MRKNHIVGTLKKKTGSSNSTKHFYITFKIHANIKYIVHPQYNTEYNTRKAEEEVQHGGVEGKYNTTLYTQPNYNKS